MAAFEDFGVLIQGGRHALGTDVARSVGFVLRAARQRPQHSPNRGNFCLVYTVSRAVRHFWYTPEFIRSAYTKRGLADSGCRQASFWG